MALGSTTMLSIVRTGVFVPFYSLIIEGYALSCTPKLRLFPQLALTEGASEHDQGSLPESSPPSSRQDHSDFSKERGCMLSFIKM